MESTWVSFGASRRVSWILGLLTVLCRCRMRGCVCVSEYVTRGVCSAVCVYLGKFLVLRMCVGSLELGGRQTWEALE